MDVRSPSARGRLLLPDFAGDGGYVALTGLAARPLPGCSVDYTLIFWVWHHVQDKPRAAREIARVTRPGGTLLLRAQFSDHLPRLWWLEHFPGGEEAHPVPFQPLADVRGVLEAAGWQVTEFAVIKEPSPGTQAAALERLRLRTFSVFEQLSAAAIETGFERFEAAVAADPGQARSAGTVHSAHLDQAAGLTVPHQ